MKLLLSLILLLLITFAVLFYQTDLPEIDRMMSAMSVGFLMLGAYLAGRLFDQINLPKISGYILFGVIVGPYLLGLIPKSQLPHLSFANDLAVALIALTAGGEIRLQWLRGRVAQLLILLISELLVVSLVVIVVMMAARSWLPFLEGKTFWRAVTICLVAAVIMIANSPTVVIAMISDYRAKGPLSQTTLAFTVLKDLALIILFATVMSLARTVLGDQETLSPAFLVAISVQLIGSIGLGVILGTLMAWYVHRVRVHLPLFIIGCCLFFALLGEQEFVILDQHIHLETLLIALAAGLLMQNAWPESSEPLFHSVESLSLPVYALFFALAGAKVNLDAFQALWYLSLGMVIVRGAAIWTGTHLGVLFARMQGDWTRYFWLGLIPQAGVSLVLVTLVGRSFDNTEWGPLLSNMLIGMIVVHELLGPVGFRFALQRSGEIGNQPEATVGRQPSTSH